MKSLDRIVILLSLVAVMSICPGLGHADSGDKDPQKVREEQIRSGQDAFEAGELAQAWDEVRSISVASLDDAQLLLVRGEIAEAVGEFRQASAAYAKAETIGTPHPALLYRKASLAARMGQYDRALGYLTRIIEQQEDSHIKPVAQFMVDLHIEQGAIEVARKLAWTHRVLVKERLYCFDGKASLVAGNMKSTYENYRLGILAHPKDDLCMTWYAWMMVDAGFVRMARVLILEAARVTKFKHRKVQAENFLSARLAAGKEISKEAEQLILIGRHRLLRDGDPKAATALLRRAMSLAPHFDRSYLLMSIAARERADTKQEVSWIRRALSADPNSWAAHRALGRTLVRLGQHREAEPHLQKAMKLYEKDIGSRLLLAQVYYQLGSYKEYSDITQEALVLGSQMSRPLGLVQRFYNEFHKNGPVEGLPPVVDPPMEFGWHPD